MCPPMVSFVPQLMRMVLNESLKTLRAQAWDERSVAHHTCDLASLRLSPWGLGSRASLTRLS